MFSLKCNLCVGASSDRQSPSISEDDKEKNGLAEPIAPRVCLLLSSTSCPGRGEAAAFWGQPRGLTLPDPALVTW